MASAPRDRDLTAAGVVSHLGVMLAVSALVVVVGPAVDLIGTTGLVQVEVLAELEAGYAEDREAVEAAFVH